MTSDLAITDDDWSMMNLAPPWPSGTAIDTGLVPTTGLLPPVGAMEAGALVKPQPIRPASASRAVWMPRVPQLYELVTASAAMPFFLAAGMILAKPLSMAG